MVVPDLPFSRVDVSVLELFQIFLGKFFQITTLVGIKQRVEDGGDAFVQSKGRIL